MVRTHSNTKIKKIKKARKVEIVKEGKVGQPALKAEDVLKLLEEAFLCGATDEQACFNAGVSVGWLYEYQKKNPDYAERKKSLKADMKYRAKSVVKDAINEGDLSTAKWVLEKTDDEYKAKPMPTVALTQNNIHLPGTQDLKKKYLEDLKKLYEKSFDEEQTEEYTEAEVISQ